jgi:hypothetical protein
VSLLTPYKETTLNGNKYQEPVPDLIDGQPEWEVEQILGAKKQCNQLQYLVRWKGFSKVHDSWEPLAHIHADQLIKEFYHTNPQAIRSTIYKTSPISPHSVTIRHIQMSTPPSTISSPFISTLPLPLSEHIDDAPLPLPLSERIELLPLIPPLWVNILSLTAQNMKSSSPLPFPPTALLLQPPRDHLVPPSPPPYQMTPSACIWIVWKVYPLHMGTSTTMRPTPSTFNMALTSLWKTGLINPLTSYDSSSTPITNYTTIPPTLLQSLGRESLDLTTESLLSPNFPLITPPLNGLLMIETSSP